MIYVNNNTPIRAIYQNGKFILFVVKGTPYATVYFPGGGGAKAAVTGFSQSEMASFNSNAFYTGDGHYVPNTTVISDTYIMASTGWELKISDGYPWLFYKADGGYSTSQILVNFRVYSPFAATLTYGHGIVSATNFGGATEYTMKSTSIVEGYNYISDTLTVTTKDTRKYITPLAFGSWSSNWTMSHMAIQMI